MNDLVDARGLSCPQPVLITMEKLRSLQQGELVVLVDTDTSKENVIRAAKSLGWELKDLKTQGTEFQLVLGKG